jgi:hypothetical protein
VHCSRSCGVKGTAWHCCRAGMALARPRLPEGSQADLVVRRFDKLHFAVVILCTPQGRDNSPIDASVVTAPQSTFGSGGRNPDKGPCVWPCECCLLASRGSGCGRGHPTGPAPRPAPRSYGRRSRPAAPADTITQWGLAVQQRYFCARYFCASTDMGNPGRNGHYRDPYYYI